MDKLSQEYMLNIMFNESIDRSNFFLKNMMIYLTK